MASSSRLTWTFLAHSEIGLVRKNNQDSGFVGQHLLLVADGMGGAAAGDLASAVAVEEISGIDAEVARAETDEDSAGETRLTLLTNAIHAANSRIADLISDDHNLEGMGTTVTGGLLVDDRLSLAHIGDSRAYLLRDGRLERLTHDHSWVQSLIDDGKISEDEAAVHPHRSLLLKVLNGQAANEPDTTTVELEAGDRLLFCSDGLCGFVDDADIATDLGADTLEQSMDSLVGAAHAAGGLDNITIILAAAMAAPVEAPAPTGKTVPTEQSGGRDEAAGSPPVPQILGAAAERDIPNNDTMIRSRAELAGVTGELAMSGDSDSPGDDEDRYAPQPPDRRRFLRPLAALVVIALVIGAALTAGFAWSRTQYYVGAASDQVAIFQGLSDSIPGLPLSRVYEVQQIRVSTLPVIYQDMVRSGIDVSDLSTARITVDQLHQVAQRCEQERARPSSSAKPSPSASSSGKASISPSGKSTGTPTGKSTVKASSASSPAITAGATTSSPVSSSGAPSASSSGSLPGGNQAC